MARPRKNITDIQNVMVKVYITEFQYYQICEYATEHNKSLSSAFRDALTNLIGDDRIDNRCSLSRTH